MPKSRATVSDVVKRYGAADRDYAKVTRRSRAKEAAPSWLPNWRQPDQYPKNGKATPAARWAWEFLRRNPAYVSDYERAKSAPDSDEAPISQQGICIPPARPLETKRKWLRRIRADRPEVTARFVPWFGQVTRDYGLTLPADPAKPALPMFAHLGGTCVQYVPPDLCPPSSVTPKGPEEVYFRFDLRAPWSWQVARFAWLFEEMAEHGEEEGDFKRINPRERINDFQQCLRAMDGRTYGYSIEEIGAALLPRMDSVAAAKKVSRWLQKGKFYSSEGYRFLVEIAPT